MCKLAVNARFRRETGLFVIEGLRLCSDAVKSSYSITETFFTGDFLSRHGEIFKEISSASEECYEVSPEVMAKMSNTISPSGILCTCPLPCEDEDFLKQSETYVALEGLSDPGNIGALSRSAEALGISGMILGSGCDPYNPKALRASMGALLRLPVYLTGDLCEVLKQAHIKNIPVFGSVVRDAHCEIQNADFSKGGIMVIGNEARGLSEKAASLCSDLVTIPMSGRSESLNAAAAGAILLWEMSKKGRASYRER